MFGGRAARDAPQDSSRTNPTGGSLSQAAPPVSAPASPAPAGGLANRRAVILAVAAGALAAIVLLVVLVAAGGRDPLRGGGGGGPDDLSGPAGGPIPPDGRPIPEEGNVVYLGGGVVSFAIPDGWVHLARGDDKLGPGGHPEGVVLRHSATGVSFGVYVLPQAQDAAARVNEEAQASAQAWTKDGTDVVITQPQGADVAGSINAAVSLRFAYVLGVPGGGPREGEMVLATRADGFGVAVFVDAPQGGALDASQEVWGPLRSAALANFGQG